MVAIHGWQNATIVTCTVVSGSAGSWTYTFARAAVNHPQPAASGNLVFTDTAQKASFVVGQEYAIAFNPVAAVFP